MMLADKVIVGAIHGYAVGGGFEWLCNCDMVVAADDLVAFFPEMEWAQFVTGAVTHLLPQAIGHQRAMRLMVPGERQTARDLEALGLVGWVVAREAMLPKALDVAGQVAARVALLGRPAEAAARRGSRRPAGARTAAGGPDHRGGVRARRGGRARAEVHRAEAILRARLAATSPGCPALRGAGSLKSR